jgi:hypothetical protein
MSINSVESILGSSYMPESEVIVILSIRISGDDRDLF